MKSVGTAYWDSLNTGATNESGFSVLPGGYRYFDGTFNFISYLAFFWSANEFDHSNAWFRGLFSNDDNVTRANDLNKSVGAFVRCLKD
jgi:uncharacterized protein (TIGR02145 family)